MTATNTPLQLPGYNFLPQSYEELAVEHRRLLMENRKLLEENHRLLEENEGLNNTVKDLQRRLLLYENPNTPPSRRIIYPRPERKPGSPRYPGRPRGHRGVTRSKPEPDITIEPPRREWCTCGSSASWEAE